MFWSSWFKTKLKVRTRFINNEVLFLDLKGSLIPGKQYYDVLREDVEALTHAQNKKMVLNLSGVAHLDIACVRELIALSIWRSHRGQWPIKIVGVAENLGDLTVQQTLHGALAHYPSEARAIQSFS